MVTTQGTATSRRIGGWTRAELRAMIGSYFGYWRSQATGGSTTTLIDSRLVAYADDYWNGTSLYIADADGAPPQYDAATVVDFVSATATLSLTPALGAAVEAGDTYELFQRVTVEQIHDAIARVAAGNEAVKPLTVSAATVSYSLEEVEGLYRADQVVTVWRRPNRNPLRQPVEVLNWQIEDDEGKLTLRLAEAITTGDDLWIVYRIGPDSVLGDDEMINVPPTLIRARAIVYLLENLLTGQDDAGLQRYGTLLRDMREVAAREAAAYHPRPGRAIFYPWRRALPPIPGYYRIFGDLP